MSQITPPSLGPQKPPPLNPIVNSVIEELKLEQNLLLGIIGGSLGGLLGAIIWAAATYYTEHQFGWLAIGVGFLCGFGVRLLGKGIDQIYGIIGGIISFFGVALGNFLASILFLAKAWDVSFFDALFMFNYAKTFELMQATFSAMDILFYVIAILIGYKNSFRRITKTQIAQKITASQD